MINPSVLIAIFDFIAEKKTNNIQLTCEFVKERDNRDR